MTNFKMRYCLKGVEIWVPLQKTILSKGGGFNLLIHQKRLVM